MSYFVMGLAPILLSATESAEFLAVSERLFHQLRHLPDFPKSIALSRRCIRWRRDELTEYAKNLPRVGAQSEPAQLKRGRNESKLPREGGI